MKNILILVIAGALLLGIGAGIGVMLQSNTRSKIDISNSSMTEFAKQQQVVTTLLQNQALNSVCINAAGEVIEIGENKIIIMREQSKIEFTIWENVHISRLVFFAPGEQPTQEAADLNQIQQGDRVSIYAVVTTEGVIEARGIQVSTISPN